MKVVEPGTGTRHPDADHILTLSYVGWKKDGTQFDQSPPVELMYRQLAPGWAEGVGYMVEGEKRRLWVPATAAYGDTATGGRPAGDITLDVKLVKIGKRAGHGASDQAAAVTPIPAPDDVAAPPKTATKTKSGLAWRILTPGKGAHPLRVGYCRRRLHGMDSGREDVRQFRGARQDGDAAARTGHQGLDGGRSAHADR